MKTIAFILFLLGSGFALYVLILESRHSARRTLTEILERNRELDPSLIGVSDGRFTVWATDERVASPWPELCEKLFPPRPIDVEGWDNISDSFSPRLGGRGEAAAEPPQSAISNLQSPIPLPRPEQCVYCPSLTPGHGRPRFTICDQCEARRRRLRSPDRSFVSEYPNLTHWRARMLERTQPALAPRPSPLDPFSAPS